MKKVNIYEVDFEANCKVEDWPGIHKLSFLNFIVGNTDVLKKIKQGYTDYVDIIEDSIKLNLYRKDVYFDETADKEHLSCFRVVEYYKRYSLSYPEEGKTLFYFITSSRNNLEFIRKNRELEKMMEYPFDSMKWAVIKQDVCEIKDI